MYVYIVAVCSAVEFHEIHFFVMIVPWRLTQVCNRSFFVCCCVGILLMDGSRVLDMQTSKYYAFQ